MIAVVAAVIASLVAVLIRWLPESASEEMDRITFVFGPAHSSLRGLLDQQKPWLDAAAERVAGRKIGVTSELSSTGSQAAPASPESRLPADAGTAKAGIPNSSEAPENKRDLKAEAMSSSTVQAMLEVFPAEIRDVEEM